MIALLIHFLGHLLVDSAVPPYIGSADSYFLVAWYAAFAAVDLIAMSLATGFIRFMLRVSFAWSCGLVIESLLLLDALQRYDWVAQYAIDGILFATFTLMLAHTTRTNNLNRYRP